MRRAHISKSISLVDYLKTINDRFKLISNHSKTIKSDYFNIVSNHF